MDDIRTQDREDREEKALDQEEPFTGGRSIEREGEDRAKRLEGKIYLSKKNTEQRALKVRYMYLSFETN